MPVERSETGDDALRPDVRDLFAQHGPPPLGSDTRRRAQELAGQLPPAPEAALLGATLDDYELVSVLGRGGQATVYLAQDREGRRYALKTPHRAVVARLIREAQILFHLDHPHVVRVERAQVQGEVPYVLTEYLPDGTLAERLREEGALPPERVQAVAWQILDALAYAHAKGVVHRDLKPSNVLFAPNRQVKVADFGIGSLSLLDGRQVAQTLVSGEHTLFCGTPLYMAPEQARDAHQADARADLYALGKLLYEALTGRAPHTVKPPSRLRPELDPGWDEFLFKLLEDDPQDRFASAAAAQEALRQIGVRRRPTPGRNKAPRRSEPRLRPLSYAEADIERINKLLELHRQRNGAQCGFVIDVQGHPVTQVGSLEGINLDMIAALAAASFATTRELARSLGGATFTTLTHEAPGVTARVVLCEPQTLLVLVFRPGKALSASAEKDARALARHLALLVGRLRSQDQAQELEHDETMRSIIDDLFGDL